MVTDLASRGIDAESVPLIINFEVPEGREAYVHRTGRTARTGVTGLPEEKQDKAFKVGKDITKIYINGGRKKKIRPGDLVGAITSIEGVDAWDMGIIEVGNNVSYVDILNNILKYIKQFNCHWYWYN